MIYINQKAHVDEAVSLVEATFGPNFVQRCVQTGIILGSGQSGFIGQIKVLKSVDFADIPHMPLPTGALHPGKLVLGEIEDDSATNLCKVIVSVGRLHPYDGLNAQQVVFPLELMARLGVKNVILCNASGAINPQYKVGDLFLIRDHINFTGMNPLLPANQSSNSDQPVFPALEQAYNPQLTKLINDIAQTLGLGKLGLSTYIGVLGPSFETPAEIKAFASWGADLVGMSTVLEAIAAAALQLNCAAIALSSNMAAGVTEQAVSVDDIVNNTSEAVEGLFRLLKTAVLRVHQGDA